MSNFIKIRPVGVQLFRADGRTDITKLIFAVRSFPKALKKFNIKVEYSKAHVSDLTFLQVSVFLFACCILNLCLVCTA